MSPKASVDSLQSSETHSPAKIAPDNAPIIPEATANLFSLATFEWVTPLLVLGYKVSGLCTQDKISALKLSK